MHRVSVQGGVRGDKERAGEEGADVVVRAKSLIIESDAVLTHSQSDVVDLDASAVVALSTHVAWSPIGAQACCKRTNCNRRRTLSSKP